MEWLGPDAIYKQIAAVLADRIDEGVYRPGHPLPTTVELCDEFEVSHKTIRAAVAILTEQGLVVGAQGRGRYVTWPEDRKPPASQ